MVREPKPIKLDGNFNRNWYLQKVNECEEKIKQQNEKIDALKRVYLRQNAEFEIGEKVQVKTVLKPHYINNGQPVDTSRYKIRIAYVYQITIGKNGNIIYKLHKASVNGHETKQREYLEKHETIHKIGTYKE